MKEEELLSKLQAALPEDAGFKVSIFDANHESYLIMVKCPDYCEYVLGGKDKTKPYHDIVREVTKEFPGATFIELYWCDRGDCYCFTMYSLFELKLRYNHPFNGTTVATEIQLRKEGDEFVCVNSINKSDDPYIIEDFRKSVISSIIDSWPCNVPFMMRRIRQLCPDFEVSIKTNPLGQSFIFVKCPNNTDPLAVWKEMTKNFFYEIFEAVQDLTIRNPLGRICEGLAKGNPVVLFWAEHGDLYKFVVYAEVKTTIAYKFAGNFNPNGKFTPWIPPMPETGTGGYTYSGFLNGGPEDIIERFIAILLHHTSWTPFCKKPKKGKKKGKK